jgi:hypothetical protein
MNRIEKRPITDALCEDDVASGTYDSRVNLLAEVVLAVSFTPADFTIGVIVLIVKLYSVHGSRWLAV